MRCVDIEKDWKKEAERLKFDEGLSWAQLYAVMRSYFPDLTDKQVEEKVRRALRDSPRYHTIIENRQDKTHFSYNYGTSAVHLYILGDAHIGAEGFQKAAFQKYVRKIENDPLAAVIVIGDILDNATLGSKGCVYSQRLTPQKQIECAIDMLTPIKDKIVFYCGGNHELRSFKQTGTDPSYTICLGLGLLGRYNPLQGYISITACGRQYRIFATHNIGRTETRLKSMARSHADCDLVVGGHIHQAKVVSAPQRMFNGAIKNAYAITCGSFLKDEGYAINAAFEPSGDVQPMILLDDGIKVLTM